MKSSQYSEKTKDFNRFQADLTDMEFTIDNLSNQVNAFNYEISNLRIFNASKKKLYPETKFSEIILYSINETSPEIKLIKITRPGRTR